MNGSRSPRHALPAALIAQRFALDPLLPRWTHDVKGFWLAPALRRMQLMAAAVREDEATAG